VCDGFQMEGTRLPSYYTMRYDRNPNNGIEIVTETRTCAAHQTVSHDEQHLSHLTFPLISR